MKRFAFLVLVFVVNVVSAEKEISLEEWAEDFDSDVKTIKVCLEAEGMTEKELGIIVENYDKFQDDDVSDETAKMFERYSSFVACMLEKEELMKDSKVVISKVLEIIMKTQNKYSIKINKDIVKECLVALNEDSELTREDRAMGLLNCETAGNENIEKDKKK